MIHVTGSINTILKYAKSVRIYDVTMALHQRFFEAAQIDLDAARVMTDRGLYQPAIYHSQQAYEKCIKSYFIFKEVNINNTPEATVYQDIWHRLGHDTEESSITLLKDIANIEKRAYESRLPNITDVHQSQALLHAISAIDNYGLSLDRLARRLDLRRNYIDNVRNYSDNENKNPSEVAKEIIINSFRDS
jgi:HEPN domain-containing protein